MYNPLIKTRAIHTTGSHEIVMNFSLIGRDRHAAMRAILEYVIKVLSQKALSQHIIIMKYGCILQNTQTREFRYFGPGSNSIFHRLVNVNLADVRDRFDDKVKSATTDLEQVTITQFPGSSWVLLLLSSVELSVIVK
jgi:hypothetical protein